MINVEVKKSGNENAVSLLRKFSRKVKNSGVLPRLRGIRYHDRNVSENVKRKKTLKQIRRREEVNELIKLGKLTPKTKGRGGRRK